MDVDSLMCLNSDEKNNLEMLRLKNAKKSLSDIFKTLEESIDSVVHDGDDGGILLNFDRIPNSLESTNSSASALGDLIDVVTSRISELKNIMDSRKTNHLDHKPSDDVFNLIMQPNKDQPISENLKESSNLLEKGNEICSRYPELFEIFVEESKTQFSNLSQKSETEAWDSNNVDGRSFSCEAREKLNANSNCSFQNFQRSKVNLEDAEVSSDKTSTSIPKKVFPQKSSGDIREEILLEKLQSLAISFERLEKGKTNNYEAKVTRELHNLKSLKEDSSTFDFRTPIHKFSLPNNLSNSKSRKKPEINLRSCDAWEIEYRSSSINRVPNSLENTPPFSSILSPRTAASNTSLNSWRTLRDTPRTNDENNFPGASFNSKSIHELEIDSKRIKTGMKRGKSKSKSGDGNKIKKKKKLSLEIEKIHGDIELKKSRVLVIKSDTKITNENSKGVIDIGEYKKQNSILRDILDILLEVELNLFSNRKSAELMKERFQNVSVLQSVVSFNAIESLNEGISRCAMNIENWENNRQVIIGVEELLLDSVLRLKEAVKEERDYLNQQEYYYSKHSSELVKNNKKKTVNLKRTTIHTLTGNDSSVTVTQKDKIEELISYIISLIKKILPKKDLKEFRKRNLSHVKSEKVSQTKMEIFPKPKEIAAVGKIFKNVKEIIESKPRVDPTLVKQNPEQLRTFKKIISNDKFTRSSTLTLNGSSKDSKQASNHVMKFTNKGRCPNTTQPIWKPAGNAKSTIPVQPILRQKTRSILSSSDKNKEKQTQGVTRTQSASSRNISAKESSIHNSKSHIQKSSTNFRSSDLRKKSDIYLKKETKENVKSEARNWNLNSNREVLKTKRKSKQPEAIKMLKEIIKSTSEEENLNEETPLKGLETFDCNEEISVRYLQSRNKIESPRSIFASTSMITQENLNNPAKMEFKVESFKTARRSENPLKNTVESKSKTKWNSLQSRTHFEEDKGRILKTSSARIPNSERKTFLAKSLTKNKVSSARVIDSRSKTIIKDSKLEDKKSKNVSLHSSKSSNLRSGSETKFPKPYLKKNASNSSYLQSYIKLNSRQNLVSNNSLRSAREKTEVKRENSEYICDTLSENEAKSQVAEIEIEDKKKNEEFIESTRSKELIDYNLESEETWCSLKAFSSCKSLTKISSSKYCQASFEPSISSRISGDLYSEDSNEVQKSFEDFSTKKKKKFVNKHTRFSLILKDILKNHGVDGDLVDEAERKLKSKRKGSKSIFYDDGDGTILSVCSSKTLYEKLACLSDSSFEELEIQDAMNQCSLESSDQEIQVSESQEYFQTSETSLSSQSVKKPRNSYSRFVLTCKKGANEKVSDFSQTMFSSRKTAESQISFLKNVQTETEKTILENLSCTDVEVSCTLENSFPSRKEVSTEISFKRSCCEIDTQTKFNSEKDTITDFGLENLEIEDSNKILKETVEDILEINSFLENENFCKLSEEIQLENLEEDFGMESENIARVSEDILIDDSVKMEIEFQDNEKEFGIEFEDICKITEDISTMNSLLREEKEKEKEAKLDNFEEGCGKDSVIELETCSDQVIDSFDKLSLGNSQEKIEQSSQVPAPNISSISESEIKAILDNTSEINSQVKVISKLEVTPSFLVFYNKKMPDTKPSKAKMETERIKNYKQAQFSESYKKISQIKRRKENTFKECKNCGGKCRGSLNLSCPSELFRPKNQDFFSSESISSDNNSSIVKYENRSENLAVETLKLATERVRNLYEEILLCKTSLSPRSAENPTKEKSFRGKMKRNFEEAAKSENDNLYLKLSKRKKEAKDIEADLYFTTEETKLFESEDFFQENRNFLIKNIGNFKSKNLTTTLQNFQNRESSLPLVPEVKELIIHLVESVEKNLEESNDKASNFQKRNEERIPIENNFSETCLLSVVYTTGALFSIIFWCFYSFIIHEG